jgi:hypothetical protein
MREGVEAQLAFWLGHLSGPTSIPSDDDFDDLDEMDLDELIEHVTVDADGDEGYWSFRQAFEDHVQYPVPASIVGAEVVVTAIDFDGDERRGLVAVVECTGRTWTVSLLDLEIEQARVSRLTRAYRRWLGMAG